MLQERHLYDFFNTEIRRGEEYLRKENNFRLLSIRLLFPWSVDSHCIFYNHGHQKVDS